MKKEEIELGKIYRIQVYNNTFTGRLVRTIPCREKFIPLWNPYTTVKYVFEYNDSYYEDPFAKNKLKVCSLEEHNILYLVT